MFAETALARLTQSSLERVFAVNTFGPILVSKVRHGSTVPAQRGAFNCC